METIQVVDIEALVGSYLRSQDYRAVGRTPDSHTDSWVRVTMLSAPTDPSSTVDWLIAYLVQLDCYAGSAGVSGSQQKEAVTLAQGVRAALHAMPSESFDEGVVTAVRSNMSRIPDTEFEPARERVIITSTIHAHPRPSEVSSS